jgi:hypothetical protein
MVDEKRMRRLLAGILMHPNHTSGFDVAIKIGDRPRAGSAWLDDVWRPLYDGGYLTDFGNTWGVSEKGLEFLKGGGDDTE